MPEPTGPGFWGWLARSADILQVVVVGMTALFAWRFRRWIGWRFFGKPDLKIEHSTAPGSSPFVEQITLSRDGTTILRTIHRICISNTGNREAVEVEVVLASCNPEPKDYRARRRLRVMGDGGDSVRIPAGGFRFFDLAYEDSTPTNRSNGHEWFFCCVFRSIVIADSGRS